MAASNDLSVENLLENIEEQKMEVMSMESMFPEKITVLSTPPDDLNEESISKELSPSNLYKFKLSISVDLTDIDKLKIEASKPREDEVEDEDVAGARNVTGTTNNKPQFTRSISGHRWQAHFLVSHLTPLCLDVVLPESYPSLSPPRFTLSCLWLGLSELDALCKELDRIWEENQGMAVIYLWMDWLQNSALSYLGLEDTIYLTQLTSEENDYLKKDQDLRTLPDCINVDEGIANLLRYDYEMIQREFAQSLQNCGVCFDEKLGENFFRLADCTHHFCVDCMTSYCEFHVKEGTVQQLTCPTPKCTTPLPPGLLQAVLDEEEFDRWERLLLQNSLDMMGDIEWCPRCNTPVIREQEEHLHLAHCTACIYSFCTKCKEPWHQGRKCADDSDDEDDEKPKESRREARRKRAEKHKLYKMSKSWINKFTKSCSKCNSPIEKNGGCNKVTCSRCYTSICWICSKCINDYSHFATCSLWAETFTTPRNMPERPVPEGAQRVKRHMREHREAGVERLVNCPRCGQRNLKENRDNHIRCFSCRAHFCFMCRQVIQPPVTSHYKIGSTCVQHSD